MLKGVLRIKHIWEPEQQPASKACVALWELLLPPPHFRTSARWVGVRPQAHLDDIWMTQAMLLKQHVGRLWKFSSTKHEVEREKQRDTNVDCTWAAHLVWDEGLSDLEARKFLLNSTTVPVILRLNKMWSKRNIASKVDLKVTESNPQPTMSDTINQSSFSLTEWKQERWKKPDHNTTTKPTLAPVPSTSGA